MADVLYRTCSTPLLDAHTQSVFWNLNHKGHRAYLCVLLTFVHVLALLFCDYHCISERIACGCIFRTFWGRRKWRPHMNKKGWECLHSSLGDFPPFVPSAAYVEDQRLLGSYWCPPSPSVVGWIQPLPSPAGISSLPGLCLSAPVAASLAVEA